MTVASPRLVRPPAPTETFPLALLGDPEFAAVVFGTPAPQGSKKAIPGVKGKGAAKQYTGKVSLVESSKKVGPWREAVAAIARTVTETRSVGPWEVLDGPLVVDMVFTMARPQKMPKGREYPHVIPDLSKLARSTEDALTGIVWKDDARVVRYRRLDKVYPYAPDTDALASPGVVIRVWRAPAKIVRFGHMMGTLS